MEKEKGDLATNGQIAMCPLPAWGGLSGDSVRCCGDGREDEHCQ